MAIITNDNIQSNAPKPGDSKREIDTIANRDLIDVNLRWPGMDVYVRDIGDGTGAWFYLNVSDPAEVGDNTKWVEFGGGGLEEAPLDNKTYSRKRQVWVPSDTLDPRLTTSFANLPITGASNGAMKAVLFNERFVWYWQPLSGPNKRIYISDDNFASSELKLTFTSFPISGVAASSDDVVFISNGTFRVSGDGFETQSEITPPENNAWEDIVRTNSHFVAVSLDGTNRIIRSTDGVTWTFPSSVESVDAWFKIAGEPTVTRCYVASTTNIMKSANNGDTFTDVILPLEVGETITELLLIKKQVAFEDDIIIVFTNQRTYKSIDEGATWKAVEYPVTPTSSFSSAVHYGPLMIVGSPTMTIYSIDKGESYVHAEFLASPGQLFFGLGGFYRAYFGISPYVIDYPVVHEVNGQKGFVRLTGVQADGSTPFTAPQAGVAAVNSNQLVVKSQLDLKPDDAPSNGSAYVRKNQDWSVLEGVVAGSSFQDLTIGSPGSFSITQVAFGVNRLVAISNIFFSPNVFNSLDGSSWVAENLSAQVDIISSLAFGQNNFIITGMDFSGSAILRSVDGVNWTLENPTVSAGDFTDVKRLAFGNNIWVAIDSSSFAYTSSDNGLNWTRVTHGTFNAYDVSWNGSKFIIAGDEPQESVNGISWIPVPVLNTKQRGNIATEGNNIILACVFADEVEISTDGGTNWTVIASPIAPVDLSFGGYPAVGVKDGIFYIAYSDEIYASTDNGTTWSLVHTIGASRDFGYFDSTSIGFFFSTGSDLHFNSYSGVQSIYALGINGELDDYVKRGGTTPFIAPQPGITPTAPEHLATKEYVDANTGGGGISTIPFSSTLLFDANTRSEHTQAGVITYSVDDTGAAESNQVVHIIESNTDAINFSKDFVITQGIVVPNETNVFVFDYAQDIKKILVKIFQTSNRASTQPVLSSVSSSNNKLDSMYLNFDQGVTFTDATGISITGTAPPTILGIAQAGSNVIRLDLSRNLTDTETLSVVIVNTNNIVNPELDIAANATVALTNNISATVMAKSIQADGIASVLLSEAAPNIDDMNVSFWFKFNTNPSIVSYYPIVSFSGTYGADVVRFDIRILYNPGGGGPGWKIECISRSDIAPGIWNRFWQDTNFKVVDNNWHFVSINLEHNSGNQPFIQIDQGAFEAQTSISNVGNWQGLSSFTGLGIGSPKLSMFASNLNGVYTTMVPADMRVAKLAIFNRVLVGAEKDELFDFATNPDWRLLATEPNMASYLNFEDTVDDVQGLFSPQLIGTPNPFVSDVPV